MKENWCMSAVMKTLIRFNQCTSKMVRCWFFCWQLDCCNGREKSTENDREQRQTMETRYILLHSPTHFICMYSFLKTWQWSQNLQVIYVPGVNRDPKLDSGSWPEESILGVHFCRDRRLLISVYLAIQLLLVFCQCSVSAKPEVS